MIGGRGSFTFITQSALSSLDMVHGAKKAESRKI